MLGCISTDHCSVETDPNRVKQLNGRIKKFAYFQDNKNRHSSNMGRARLSIDVFDGRCIDTAE